MPVGILLKGALPAAVFGRIPVQLLPVGILMGIRVIAVHKRMPLCLHFYVVRVYPFSEKRTNGTDSRFCGSMGHSVCFVVRSLVDTGYP